MVYQTLPFNRTLLNHFRTVRENKILGIHNYEDSTNRLPNSCNGVKTIQHLDSSYCGDQFKMGGRGAGIVKFSEN